MANLAETLLAGVACTKCSKPMRKLKMNVRGKDFDFVGCRPCQIFFTTADVRAKIEEAQRGTAPRKTPWD